MTSETWSREDSQLYQHAKRELEITGLLDDDSDYDGEVGKGVLNLVEMFAQQGHSGASAGLTLHLFDELVRFQPLTAVSNNPDDWMQISDGIVEEGDPPLWQCRRKGTLFSNDGGKTFYDIDQPLQPSGEPTFFTAIEHKEN